MPVFPAFLRPALSALACCAIMGLPSCKESAPASHAPVAVMAPELSGNRLADSPSTLLADQSASPIHWQKWNRETLARAKKANRLIFAVIALPQQLNSVRMIKSLDHDAKLVQDINDYFVPVLIDADSCRETAIIGAVLSADIKRPCVFPFFVWLTPEGNPVTWLPAPSQAHQVRAMFDEAMAKIGVLWKEHPDYVLANSERDNEARRARLAEMAKSPVASNDPTTDMQGALKQLGSYYDPGTHTFEYAGGLFPSSVVELLACSALTPGLPADVSKRVRDVSAGLTTDLASSAMIDPLEGCIFSSRRGDGWNVPNFTGDCASQSKAIVALAAAYRVRKDPLLLHQLLAAIHFAEGHYAAPGRLFALGRQDLRPAENWLWRMEEVEKTLTPAEFRIWTAISELKGVGNIPPESDPTREFFRLNSLYLKATPESVSGKLEMTPDTARAAFESGRAKLLALRNARAGASPEDTRPHAISTFRMASAYAAAYTATGDEELKKKAMGTLTRAREAFSNGPLPTPFPTADGPNATGEFAAGRAFLYAVAIQAGLDVADVTLDPAMRTWAGELAAITAERFMKDGALVETPAGEALIPLPVCDRLMIFDDSTTGLLALSDARFSQLGHTLPPAYSSAISPLPADVRKRPILYSDTLLAALIRARGAVVTVSPSAPAALKEAVCRLPLRVFSRRTATPADRVPEGQVNVIFTGQTARSADLATLESMIFTGPAPQ